MARPSRLILLHRPKRGLYFFGTVRELLDVLIRMPDRKVVDLLR